MAKPTEKYELKKSTGGGKRDIFYVNGMCVTEKVYNEFCSKKLNPSGVFPDTKIVNERNITTSTVYIEVEDKESNASKLRSKKSLQITEAKLQNKVDILIKALEDAFDEGFRYGANNYQGGSESYFKGSRTEEALNKVKEL